jgi:hypothetical protein
LKLVACVESFIHRSTLESGVDRWDAVVRFAAPCSGRFQAALTTADSPIIEPLGLRANAVSPLGKAFLQAIVIPVLTGNLSTPINVVPSWPRVIALQHKIPDHLHCPNGFGR